MIDKVMKERSSKLIEVAWHARRQLFPRSVARLKTSAVAQTSFMTSTTMVEIHLMYAHELELRAVIIWKSLVRVHRALPALSSDLLASELKQEFSKYLRSTADELTEYLSQELNIFSGKEKFTSLNDTYDHLIQKHEVEIDLYTDALTAQREEVAVPPQYNFYGNVGAVQTGANASANVVQNLSEGDKTALIEALDLVKTVVSKGWELDSIRQDELLDTVRECVSQINSDKPNNTLLRSALSTVAMTIQALASAGPAYQALKTALMPMGIMLP